MTKAKYYDYENDHPIDLGQDGCPLEEWETQCGSAIFAKHPKGFLVFLPPEEINALDEYSEADPYTVEQNLESDFHQSRIKLTVDLLRETARFLPGGLRILDLGCGQGHITNELREAYPSAEISGIDYSMSAVEYAHEHFPTIDFVVGNAYQCPYARKYFDVIVCNNLWEHVPDPLVLLDKIRSILRPGGYLIISTPSRYNLANIIRVLRGKPVILASSHHVTEYSVGQVLEQLGYGGFHVLKIASESIKLHSLKARLAHRLILGVISLTGSHHQLAPTVLYLAQKN